MNIQNRASWAASLVLTAVLGTLAAPIEARAGSFSLAFGQAQYDVAVGGQTSVNVYLEETVGANETSVLATDGLVGAGFRVYFDGAPAPSSPAQVLSDSDVTPAPGFDSAAQAITISSGSYAELIENVDLFSPAVTATDLGGGHFQILLGSFNFTAGSVEGETTPLEARVAPGLDYFVTGAGDALSDTDIASASSQVHVLSSNGAVPEPASWLLLAFGSVGLAGLSAARRRRRAS